MRFSISDLLVVFVVAAFCIALNSQHSDKKAVNRRPIPLETVHGGIWLNYVVEYGFPFVYRTVVVEPITLEKPGNATPPWSTQFEDESYFHIQGSVGNVIFCLLVGAIVFFVRRLVAVQWRRAKN